jgi:hypothetical protein
MVLSASAPVDETHESGDERFEPFCPRIGRPVRGSSGPCWS